MIDFVGADNEPLWKGVALALLLFAVMELRSFLLGQYFYSMFRLGVLVQTVLTQAIYNKVTVKIK
jgi:hypothetical protein